MSPHRQETTPEIRVIEAMPRSHWLQRLASLAQREPDRIALVSGGNVVTFGELVARSNRIAADLAHKGIGSGHFVGVGFHRSDHLIAALLGILKSGAAYLPLDPGYPDDRIAQMITSAGLHTVITHSTLSGKFPGVRVISSDEPTNTSSEYDGAGLAADDPVYAIFTSGSTGQPKAASVFHSGFSNLLDWYCDELELGSGDRTLVISSPSFDLTQKNLFAPLISGGTLILDDCQTYDIPRILDLIQRHGVTLVNCTPSAFYPLVDAAAGDGFQALSSLRFAVLGGEPISIPRLRAWLENPGCNAQVVNSYGPTECTDICLYHRLHRGNLDQFPFVPLGREIPNVRVSIRDANLVELPDGETGELCITGHGLGGGYLNDPARTAARFVGSSPQLYRTGDLAIRLPCGTFEFRGRADYQVKVNGFRIELGEVELALNHHQGVKEAVVTASETKLTAHVHGSVTAGELRLHLASKLPAYMIPAEFHFLESIPLTPNGKVDRKRLSDHDGPEAGKQTIQVQSDLEAAILALWSEILGHPVTDPCGNFFDLGGNSIHLAIVHVRLREMTGRDFPITDLFALPNVRKIAAHLSPRQTVSSPNAAQDRARLAKAGLARFQRPINR